jgi:uncharacterized membrane protein YqhA
MQRFLSASRYLILVAVIGSFLAATVLILYGGYNTVRLVINTVSFLGGDPAEIKNVAVNFIGIVDVFLLSTIFYIIALGLYELFIDDQVKVPTWLEIHSLDDLKEKLIGVIIIVMGVFFLEKVVTWKGELDLLQLGVAIAVVIAALTYFLSQISRHH